MKSYNGFSPQQRRRALRWYNTQVERGARPLRPCDACHEPVARGHSEDYNEPYGPHIGAFSLCHKCHLVVHCRFRETIRWEDRRNALREKFGRDTPLDDIANGLTFPVHRAPQPEESLVCL